MQIPLECLAVNPATRTATNSSSMQSTIEVLCGWFRARTAPRLSGSSAARSSQINHVAHEIKVRMVRPLLSYTSVSVCLSVAHQAQEISRLKYQHKVEASDPPPISSCFSFASTRENSRTRRLLRQHLQRLCGGKASGAGWYTM